MPTFIDAELGEIVVTKRRGSHAIHIKVSTDGRFAVTAPYYTPLIAIKQVVKSSRAELKKLKDQSHASQIYSDGQQVSKHHSLAVIPTQMVKKPTTKVQHDRLLVYLPPGFTLSDTAVQQQIKDTIVTILRKEAKKYLPKRLSYIAKRYDFHYDRIRFSHSSGRWGSCSSKGTISLNIALMRLPDDLIDYVLIHELCHTRHMNHSPQFWREVEHYDPQYRTHKQLLKHETPIV